MRSIQMMMKRIVNSGTVASVVSFQLITGSGTPLQSFTNAHFIF